LAARVHLFLQATSAAMVEVQVALTLRVSRSWQVLRQPELTRVPQTAGAGVGVGVGTSMGVSQTRRQVVSELLMAVNVQPTPPAAVVPQVEKLW